MNARRIITLLILTNCLSGFSQVTDSIKSNRNIGFEVTTGLQGTLSFAQIGINYNPPNQNFWIGTKFRAMSCINWVTFINQETSEEVSFHPTVLAGIVTFGGTSMHITDLFRGYGYVELMLGYTSTPYDSYFYDVPNLVGKNTTYGIFGLYGIEFYTSKKVSLFIESGGGYKNIKVDDKENPYAIACSWIGSGITFRMGTIIYLK